MEGGKEGGEGERRKGEGELCDYSWREYINGDCMTDANDPSYPTPFSSYKKIKEPYL